MLSWMLVGLAIYLFLGNVGGIVYLLCEINKGSKFTMDGIQVITALAFVTMFWFPLLVGVVIYTFLFKPNKESNSA